MRNAVLVASVALAFVQVGVGQEPCAPQRVVSPPEIGTDDFGSAVRTNGAQWFVGAADARTLCAGTAIGCSSGAVFVYEIGTGSLTHVQTIVPPDVALYDKFGISVDVDGNRLVVGSLYTRPPDSALRTGAAFVYEYDGSEWVEVDRIWPPPSVSSLFASDVHMAGESVIVTPSNAKSAFVYARDSAGEWELSQVLEHPDPSQPPAGFGYQWASLGDWLVTGAHADRRVHPSGGAVFIFRRTAAGMFELFQEISPDPERMMLGVSVGFAGDTLLVGAPLASRDEDYQGVVRLYDFDGERWTLAGELAQDRPGEGRKFGMRVLGLPGRVFASAFEEWTTVSHGMVYGFERGGDGGWTQTERFVPTTAHYANLYGSALASDGEHLLAGAMRDETATGGVVGAAYFFDLTCGECEADLDLDGALTVFDFLTYLNLFQDADPLADFDGDGELTIFDFLAFRDAFEAGCG